MSEEKSFKSLAKELIASGKFDYGSSYTEEQICEMFGLIKPNNANQKGRKAVDVLAAGKEYELKLLGATGTIRDVLQPTGRHLTSKAGVYFVPTPAENARFVEDYLKQSARKSKRALTLWENTPAGADAPPDNLTARALVSLRNSNRLRSRIQPN